MANVLYTRECEITVHNIRTVWKVHVVDIAVLQMLEQPESQVPWLLNDGGDLHSWVHTLSQVYHAERHAVPLSERRIPVDHRGRPLRTVRH